MLMLGPSSQRLLLDIVVVMVMVHLLPIRVVGDDNHRMLLLLLRLAGAAVGVLDVTGRKRRKGSGFYATEKKVGLV